MKSRSRRRPAWGKIILLLIGATLLGAVWRYTPLAEYATAERLLEWSRAIRGTGWAPLAFILVYTPAAFVMFPRPLLTLMGVIAFGPWLGFAYSMIGILIAALATYYAGRLVPEETLRRWAGDKLDVTRDMLRKHGFVAILAAGFIPTPPFAVQNAIVGALGVNVWVYAAATLLGMAPGVLATSVFGRELALALEDPSTLSPWVLVLVVAVFVALTLLARRWFARRLETVGQGA